jgi:hypothetical protein
VATGALNVVGHSARLATNPATLRPASGYFEVYEAISYSDRDHRIALERTNVGWSALVLRGDMLQIVSKRERIRVSNHETASA